MLEQYEGVLNNKTEVRKYLELLNEIKMLPKNNELTCIARLIIFNKSIFINENTNNKHYNKYMIYNLLMLMHSLVKDSRINFYQLYRSLIENIVRVMLELDDNDETGVNEMFRRFTDKYKYNKVGQEFTNFIKAEYSKACDYVHSNVRANVNISLFYSEILNSDEMDNDNLIKLIYIIKTFLIKFTEFIIYSNAENIECIYYRKYRELEYLIGNKLFLQFKKIINE